MHRDNLSGRFTLADLIEMFKNVSMVCNTYIIARSATLNCWLSMIYMAGNSYGQ